MAAEQGTALEKILVDVFPFEIWELILEQLDDTTDVLNVFETCPPLKVLTHGKQFSCLIGQVMPLILSKFLWYKDILACRLVSRKWNNAVATSLENHPDQQPYSVSPQKAIGITEHHFMYRRRPKIRTNFYRFMKSEWATSATKPCKINPFLGRSVTIKVDSEIERNMRYHDSEVNLAEAIPTFEKFGHFIWHITLNLDGSTKGGKTHFLIEIIPNMFKCLSFLPNLKSLEIGSFYLQNIFDGNEDASWNEATFAPFRAKLETLNLIELTEVSQNFHDALIKMLVNHDQVKRLAINDEKWNKAYAPLFPNLTELWVCTGGGNGRNYTELDEILEELKCTKLRKLRVYSDEYEVNVLLKAIEPYQIEVLEIGGEHFNDYFFEEGILLPSVRDCKVYATPYAKFKFLKALPCLEYLTVGVSHVDDPPPGDYSDSEDEEDEEVVDKAIFCKCLRDCVKEDSREPYNFDDIWNELPTLKVLTVYSDQYVREYPGKAFKSCRSESIHNFYKYA